MRYDNPESALYKLLTVGITYAPTRKEQFGLSKIYNEIMLDKTLTYGDRVRTLLHVLEDGLVSGDWPT